MLKLLREFINQTGFAVCEMAVADQTFSKGLQSLTTLDSLSVRNIYSMLYL
jgi:hypothetical protein